MPRKATLTGISAVVLLSSLAAFSQCRAGLFDGLFKKDKAALDSSLKKMDKDPLKLQKPDRRPPCRSCEFGYNATTWRPWGTCCETARPGCSTSPWSDDMVLPSPVPYGPSGGPPVGIEYYPSTPTGVDPLLVPEAAPLERTREDESPILSPFEAAPEEPIPGLSAPASDAAPVTAPLRESLPAVDDSLPRDVPASDDNLLLPQPVRQPIPQAVPETGTVPPVSVPLPTPSAIPSEPGSPQTTGVPRSWQPISYSAQPSRRQRLVQPLRPAQPQRAIPKQRSSTQWRVMPGFYGPQQSTSPVDRVTNRPQLAR